MVRVKLTTGKWQDFPNCIYSVDSSGILFIYTEVVEKAPYGYAIHVFNSGCWTEVIYLKEGA